MEDKRLKELIYKIWIDSYKRYGSPKITTVLNKLYNANTNIKRVQKLMRELKIASIITTSYKPMKQRPAEGEFSNLLRRDFTTSGINQKRFLILPMYGLMNMVGVIYLQY